MSLERRNDAVPDPRLDALYQIVQEQAKISERLLVTSEQQQKSIEKLNDWVNDHDTKYHRMDVEFNMLKASVNNWTVQFNEMKDQVKDLVAAIKAITSTGLKIQGGWLTLSVIGVLIMSAVTLAHAFGLV